MAKLIKKSSSGLKKHITRLLILLFSLLAGTVMIVSCKFTDPDEGGDDADSSSTANSTSSSETSSVSSTPSSSSSSSITIISNIPIALYGVFTNMTNVVIAPDYGVMPLYGVWSAPADGSASGDSSQSSTGN